MERRRAGGTAQPAGPRRLGGDPGGRPGRPAQQGRSRGDACPLAYGRHRRAGRRRGTPDPAPGALPAAPRRGSRRHHTARSRRARNRARVDRREGRRHRATSLALLVLLNGATITNAGTLQVILREVLRPVLAEIPAVFLPHRGGVLGRGLLHSPELLVAAPGRGEPPPVPPARLLRGLSGREPGKDAHRRLLGRYQAGRSLRSADSYTAPGPG